ncbi:uncharacterized protein LOC119066900 [Bradysia coprophila]|uniref:uncharacterized protein LOC119066900 n=1 Tax=Bradysia coprophila TaxID=38358 RepID=UPI00187DB083|nr:uncharacterized protein LOC119066900 [Bradysia coprophila]
MDLHLSPSFISRDSKLKTEGLYPHEKDCLVAMVPKQSNSEHFLEKIIREPDIQSIFLALILFAIVRMIIGKSSWKHWVSISIKSLGIFLNQDKILNKTRIEVAWDMNLRGFSVLATIALSVITYKNLMSKKYVEIDTIDELIASNLTILAPDYLKNEELWSNIKPELSTKITYKGVNDLNYDVITRRKFHHAYIFTDSAAEYMDMMLHTYVSSAKGYKQMIRIMHENLHCRLSGYRISTASPLKRYINDFVRRFVENGLYDKHLEWIRQLNSDVFQVNKYKKVRRDGKEPVVLDIDLVLGIFVLYIVGVVISVVIFLFELKL